MKASDLVRDPEGHLPVEAAGAAQRRVDGVGAVRRAHHDDVPGRRALRALRALAACPPPARASEGQRQRQRASMCSSGARRHGRSEARRGGRAAARPTAILYCH